MNDETLNAARTALAAAMRQAGHPSGSVALSVAVEQTDWRDNVGVLIDGEDDTRERAAAWLVRWCRANGVRVDSIPRRHLRAAVLGRLRRLISP